MGTSRCLVPFVLLSDPTELNSLPTWSYVSSLIHKRGVLRLLTSCWSSRSRYRRTMFWSRAPRVLRSAVIGAAGKASRHYPTCGDTAFSVKLSSPLPHGCSNLPYVVAAEPSPRRVVCGNAVSAEGRGNSRRYP